MLLLFYYALLHLGLHCMLNVCIALSTLFRQEKGKRQQALCKLSARLLYTILVLDCIFW